MEIKYRKSRDFETFSDAEAVIDILHSQFSSRKLLLKNIQEKSPIAIMEYRDDNTIIIQVDATLNLGPELFLYGLSDKYFEIDLTVLENQGGGYYHCKINSARRAVAGRRDLRFKLPSDEVVATNFNISKYTIDVSAHYMPTSIKVVLDQFHNKNYKLSDLVKVDVFSPDTSNIILDKIRKTGQALFISDVANPDSYKALTPDFIDLNELYGKDVSSISKNYVGKGYKSIIIVPIIYLTEIEESIPFAYIQLISKTENFSIDKVLEVKDLSFKLIDRIRDANTLLVTVHQRIVDISQGGAKLCITDENLKKSILKSRGFIFDVVFKLQAPITMYGEIRATYVDDKGNLMVGVDFAGNSSRKGEMKRFQSILKPKEAEYKAKLLQFIKKK